MTNTKEDTASKKRGTASKKGDIASKKKSTAIKKGDIYICSLI